MYITRHSAVTDSTARDQLFELYERAYGDIARSDVSRELLFRHEFDEVLADPTYRTTVVREEDGRPVAMATFATDIGATRYLSRPFFEQRYPERSTSGLVHYVMWIVVDPDHQGQRTTWELARGGLALEAEEGALLVFDLPESNQPNESGGGAEFFRRVAASITDVELETFGVTRYYALDFGAHDDARSAQASDDTAERSDDLMPTDGSMRSARA